MASRADLRDLALDLLRQLEKRMEEGFVAVR
jgi:hypothetical protein